MTGLPEAARLALEARTPADFSREFAGYMATAAERYCEQVNCFHKGLLEDGLKISFDSDWLTDAYIALFQAVYDWRKREAVAALDEKPGAQWRDTDTGAQMFAAGQADALERAAKVCESGEATWLAREIRALAAPGDEI